MVKVLGLESLASLPERQPLIRHLAEREPADG